MLEKLKRGVCVACLVLGLGAVEAQAKGVFLIQLGSFPSQQEAQQKWDNLKNSNTSLLGTLAPKISEVTLQPDNYTIYRTQAGPFNDKAAAQGVCSQLIAKGAECLVVETALFVPDAPASTQTAQNNATPAPVSAAPAPTPSASAEASANLPPALPVSPAQPVAQEAARASIAAEPVPASAPASVASPEALPPLPLLSESAEAQPAPPEPRTIVVDTPAESQIAAPEKKESGGLFSWFKRKNSELSDTRSEDRAAPPVETPAPASGANDAATPVELNEEAQIAAPAAPVVTVASSPAVQEVDATIAPRDPKPLFGSSRANARNLATPEVKVAEAIRVPLSESSTAAPRRLQAYTPPSGTRMLPNPYVNYKTLWAQLSHFPGEQQAWGFWNEFAAGHPDITDGMRARVTHPLTMRRGQASRVSLQVGPFAYTENIRPLCRLAEASGLRCTVTTDLGSSSAIGTGSRYRPMPARGYHSRNTLAPRGESAMGMGSARNIYWIQLGSYSSPGDAQNTWESLQQGNKELLGRQESNISRPQSGSNPRPLYRLRTGPFMSGLAATNLCGRLSGRGVNCIVVADK